MRICPKCGKVVSGSCPRCRSRSKRTPAQERERKKTNPWRSHYQSKEYRDARQVALSRTDGRCAVSGVRIADYRNGQWVLRKNGSVHHIVPLSQGGRDTPDNLLPLSVSVHNRIDAERRRRQRLGS